MYMRYISYISYIYIFRGGSYNAVIMSVKEVSVALCRRLLRTLLLPGG